MAVEKCVLEKKGWTTNDDFFVLFYIPFGFPFGYPRNYSYDVRFHSCRVKFKKKCVNLVLSKVYEKKVSWKDKEIKTKKDSWMLFKIYMKGVKSPKKVSLSLC